MLAEQPIDVMLLSTDLDEAKEFYGDRIGVEIEEYAGPGLKTVDGIADVGFALSAWIVDPSGNAIGLLEFQDEGNR
jgi:predicted enzyme related to lactoylglutathione lyase